MTTMNTGAASLSECDFVAVPRAAVEWLKEHYPALTEKAGMCERIGKRLYTKTTLATPTPQADAAIAAGGAQEPVPGTSEYGSWINKAKQATDCKLSFHRDEFKYLCQFEQELRKVYAAPLPRVAATVPQIKPRLLNQLRRFNECCEDSEAGGHDVDKEDMHSLAELGAVRPAPGGRHYLTDFGHYLLAAASNGEQA